MSVGARSSGVGTGRVGLGTRGTGSGVDVRRVSSGRASNISGARGVRGVSSGRAGYISRARSVRGVSSGRAGYISRTSDIRKSRVRGRIRASGRESRQRDDLSLSGRRATLLLNEATRSTAVRQADLGLSSSSKGDGQGRSKADVENVADLNVELDSETKSKSNELIDGDGAVVGSDEDSSVLEKADPDSNLGTSLDVENGNVKLGRKIDLSSEAEAKSERNLSREVDLGSNANGESLGNKTLKGDVNDLLGEKRNLNESLLAEGKVNTSGQVNGSIDTDDKVKSEGSTGVSLEKTGDLKLKSSRSEKFNGFVNGSGSRNVELDVGLDSTKTNAHTRLRKEVLHKLKSSITLDLSIGKVETKLNGGGSARSRSGDTVEENMVLPAVGQAASRRKTSVLAGGSLGGS